jgi:hypothetical protein
LTAIMLELEAIMVPFAGLLAALEPIPDPRRRQGRRYPLPHLLLFSVLAVLAGATSYRGLRVFMAVHRARLNAVFGTTLRRAPAVNTPRALLPCCQEQCARGGRGTMAWRYGQAVRDRSRGDDREGTHRIPSCRFRPRRSPAERVPQRRGSP